jgi:hypothetical protein
MQAQAKRSDSIMKLQIDSSLMLLAMTYSFVGDDVFAISEHFNRRVESAPILAVECDFIGD